MGYSCTAMAAYVEESMMSILHETSTPDNQKTSNVWNHGETHYFYDRGREQDDGAVTGAVWRKLPDGEHCRRGGSIRIEPDGKITRWSGSSKAQRQRAEQMGQEKYTTNHVMPADLRDCHYDSEGSVVVQTLKQE